MENYTRTSIQDAEMKEDELSSSSSFVAALMTDVQLDQNAIKMNVKTGSKINNLMTYANKQFDKDEVKQITWNGTGDALNKVVACAEIMKKRYKNLHQINKIGFVKTEEVWHSKLENLRDIKVTKEIPSMSILLSKTPLNSTESGFQTNEILDDLFDVSKKKSERQKTNLLKLNLEDDGIYIKKKRNK